MKTIRLLSLTLFFMIGFGLPACMICNCPPLEGSYFSLQKVIPANYRFLSNINWEKVAAMDTVSLDQYAMELGFDFEYVSLLPPDHLPAFSLINSAYACDCLSNGAAGSKEKIQEVNIITLNNFNEQFAAGDTINPLVELIINDTIAISDFMPQHLWYPQFRLKLKEKPASGEALQLNIILKLDNGNVLQASNEPVFVQ